MDRPSVEELCADFARIVGQGLGRDDGVRAACAVHGAVSEVWFNDLRASGDWQVIVFADGALVGERALSRRRLSPTDWKEELYRAGLRLAIQRPVHFGEAVVVTMPGGGAPRLEVVDAERFPAGDYESFNRPLFPTGPITRRLERIVAELEEVGAMGNGMMGYELGDVVNELREQIEQGEPEIGPNA